jgi:hypothetical protein
VPYSIAEQTAFFKELLEIAQRARQIVGEDCQNSALDLAELVESKIIESVNPQTIQDVRNLDELHWMARLLHLVESADTSIDKDGNEDPDGFYTDWYFEALDRIKTATVRDMVRSGAVETPSELLQWIENQAGVTA